MAIRTILPLAALILAAPASAQTVGAPLPYVPAYGDGYGFAGEFVRGDYIGAPLTQVPSPNRLVPTPWSYGTYGVPTVSGIAPAPTGRPTLMVIHAAGPKGRQRLGTIAEDRTAGAEVIAVRVPRH